MVTLIINMYLYFNVIILNLFKIKVILIFYVILYNFKYNNIIIHFIHLINLYYHHLYILIMII